MEMNKAVNNSASSRGRYFNTGNGPTIQLIDIGHDNYVALLDPDTAFWSLLKKEKISEALDLIELSHAGVPQEARRLCPGNGVLRFGLKPSAVYFNPTERCNLNCSYCYIPEDMRRNGGQMSAGRAYQSAGHSQGILQHDAT